MNNIVEYEACILGLETTLELGIRQMEVFGDSNLVLRHLGHWKTRDVKLKPYHACLELLVGRFDDLRKISPKSSNGHEFILVAIDYFTKWVEATSYATPILVYGMETVLPVEIKMGSLRVALE
ncbi:hypothetical protein CK203_056476 [Vitis vinifera]|uniref:RNase H type-1 domain-containing protein n=1 Tax=Vitis vinifera TaxID=29760 RepID=A0A438GTN7_VITVI|nr:hypothetical protein CK203_056476 [Vitis vinifera]